MRGLTLVFVLLLQAQLLAQAPPPPRHDLRLSKPALEERSRRMAEEGGTTLKLLKQIPTAPARWTIIPEVFRVELDSLGNAWWYADFSP